VPEYIFTEVYHRHRDTAQWDRCWSNSPKQRLLRKTEKIRTEKSHRERGRIYRVKLGMDRNFGPPKIIVWKKRKMAKNMSQNKWHPAPQCSELKFYSHSSRYYCAVWCFTQYSILCTCTRLTAHANAPFMWKSKVRSNNAQTGSFYVVKKSFCLQKPYCSVTWCGITVLGNANMLKYFDNISFVGLYIIWIIGQKINLLNLILLHRSE